jgi:D-alanyl-D-alanine carboxypeptidase/D-alanyl-D-alanine-endopeptidase (penicillin-binding protein 4)
MILPPASPPLRLSRRHLLASALAALAAPALAEAPDRSPRPPPRPGTPAARKAKVSSGAGIAALVAAAKLGGGVSIAVIDTASGQLLEGLDERQALPPASCAKAITALYALDRLGPAHGWVTSVLATGPVSGGQVQGDLILQGTGDPTLTTDGLGDLAARLAARGVRGVTGRFLVHAAALPHLPRIDRDQPDHVGYNPAICGLNLNHNRVYFEWKRAGGGWDLTMDARGERFVPRVAMATMRAADRASPLFTYRQGKGTEDWTVAASALGKGGSRWLPVRQPEVYAGEVFQTLARAQGIRLPDPRVVTTAPKGSVLAQLASEPLGPVMRDMLKYSTNLTAEVVGLSASGAATLAASGGRMADWLKARHGATGRFVDHSGLGGASRISAADMARALAQGRGSGLPGLLKDFGMRDAKGEGIKGHPTRVPSKTGTLNFASGLVGYIEPPGGRSLTFAILSADVARRDRLSDGQREDPEGGKAWTRRARGLQAQLVGRWAGVFV